MTNETVADMAPAELVKRAINGLLSPPSKRGRSVPLWNAVSERFFLGSTFSAQLCRKYGFDPDRLVRPPR